MIGHLSAAQPPWRGSRRRAIGIGLAAACPAAWTQPASARRKVRVGVLWTGTAPVRTPTLLEKMLRELSSAAMQVEVDARYGSGASLQRHAEELAAAQVDLLVANGTPAALLARRVTKTIPVVYLISGDPVELGLASTLAQPGSNMTGVYTMTSEVSGKRIALLHEALPQARRLGLLWTPGRLNQPELDNAQVAALSAGLTAVPLAVATRDDVARRFGALRSQGVEAVSVLTAPVIAENLRTLAGLAAEHRAPAIASYSNYTDVGGLMSYAAGPVEVMRIAVAQSAQVLKGVRPADLPVQRSQNLVLSVNLKAAAAIGLKLPAALTIQAQRVLR